VLLVSSEGATLTERGIWVIGGLFCDVNDEIVSVTLLAAFTRLPQTPPLRDPDGVSDFSSLFKADVL
jgi:hypothetical protein